MLGAGWRAAMVAVLVGLPAAPARYAADAVHARATAPLGGLRTPIELWADDRQLGEGIALVDGERLHVAFRNPLGQPVSVLRVDRGVVSVELVGEHEIVALDAVLVLRELAGVGPADLVRLALGRPPVDLGPLTAVDGGWHARSGALELVIDREGQLVRARSGAFVLIREPGQVRVSDGSVSWRLVSGPVERSVVPERAFEIGRGHVPIVRAERLASELAARAVTPP